MQRVGFILKVDRDRVEEYKRRHQSVWPEIEEALRRSGWRNYSLFIRDDGSRRVRSPWRHLVWLAGSSEGANQT